MKIRRNYGTVAFALAGSVLFFANTTAATAEPVTMEKIHSFFTERAFSNYTFYSCFY